MTNLQIIVHTPWRLSPTKPPDYSTISIFCDGSWIDKQGGWAFICSTGPHLIHYEMGHSTQDAPIFMEAMALIEAIKWATSRQMKNVSFFSDEKGLISNINAHSLLIPENWNAAKLIWKIWHRAQLQPSFSFFHIPRTENLMADALAKYGRLLRVHTEGFTYPLPCPL